MVKFDTSTPLQM